MVSLALSPFGLFLAGATSVTNVFTDVARKKGLDRHELISSTMWIRAFSTLVFTVALCAMAAVLWAARGAKVAGPPPARPGGSPGGRG
jgi:nitric oxide reductase large subunit